MCVAQNTCETFRLLTDEKRKQSSGRGVGSGKTAAPGGASTDTLARVAKKRRVVSEDSSDDSDGGAATTTAITNDADDVDKLELDDDVGWGAGAGAASTAAANVGIPLDRSVSPVAASEDGSTDEEAGDGLDSAVDVVLDPGQWKPYSGHDTLTDLALRAAVYSAAAVAVPFVHTV